MKSIIKLLAHAACLNCLVLHLGAEPVIDDSIQGIELAMPTTLTISPGVEICMQTGKVTVQDGVTLDEASLAFWKAVELAYPEWVRRIHAKDK